jgi:hypothetical protein
MKYKLVPFKNGLTLLHYRQNTNSIKILNVVLGFFIFTGVLSFCLN